MLVLPEAALCSLLLGVLQLLPEDGEVELLPGVLHAGPQGLPILQNPGAGVHLEGQDPL